MRRRPLAAKSGDWRYAPFPISPCGTPRHVDNCSRADPAYGEGVAAALRALAG